MKKGQAMLEYVLVFVAVTLTVMAALTIFARATEGKSEATVRVVTSDYP